ncbi:MAG: FkbM family methyltransferase [Planctomycetes bacterium]|nr:FkbM family methyltransferase [Planctomycetota bacterium]
MNYLKSLYRYYRESQKKRGRKRKAERQKEKMKSFYVQFIKPGQICFDIGANMGNRAEVFLELGARVVSVEPQEECCKHLDNRFGDNANFILINKALDKVRGQQEFFISNASTLSSMSSEWIGFAKKHEPFQGSNWDTKVLVETTTLDDLISENGVPVFCKIDVEGFEYNVLQGLSKQIPFISFEFTSGLIESTVKCINHLNEISMMEFNYSIGESMVFELPEFISSEQIIDVVKGLGLSGVAGGDIYARECRS